MTPIPKAIQFRRVDALPPYAFAEVERLKLELRRTGEDVIDFGFGNPDVAPPEIAVEKLREAALLPRNHRYSSSRGHLRQKANGHLQKPPARDTGSHRAWEDKSADRPPAPFQTNENGYRNAQPVRREQ